MSELKEDSFQLLISVLKLSASWSKDPLRCKPGDHFILQGEMLHLPPGQGFSIYSLAAILPLLAAKQRPTHPNDWMSTDSEIACPDPHCKSRLKIERRV
ncbi:hypothetical protein BDZ97DRAFT_999298 [Flammula alnicola]|nr:hypothetical protein BDZ97DRAFT_999298 [Flammula alnicola]